MYSIMCLFDQVLSNKSESGLCLWHTAHYICTVCMQESGVGVTLIFLTAHTYSVILGTQSFPGEPCCKKSRWNWSDLMPVARVTNGLTLHWKTMHSYVKSSLVIGSGSLREAAKVCLGLHCLNTELFLSSYAEVRAERRRELGLEETTSEMASSSIKVSFKSYE